MVVQKIIWSCKKLYGRAKKLYSRAKKLYGRAKNYMVVQKIIWSCKKKYSRAKKKTELSALWYSAHLRNLKDFVNVGNFIVFGTCLNIANEVNIALISS
jgi:hypothetical protein